MPAPGPRSPMHSSERARIGRATLLPSTSQAIPAASQPPVRRAPSPNEGGPGPPGASSFSPAPVAFPHRCRKTALCCPSTRSYVTTMPTPPVSIDWMVVATIAAPLLALVAGIWLKNVFENRPQLVTFFGAVSVFNYTAPNGTRLVVHTHDVVVRNTGRRSAHNVRLGHQTLPDHNISPAVDH